MAASEISAVRYEQIGWHNAPLQAAKCSSVSVLKMLSVNWSQTIVLPVC